MPPHLQYRSIDSIELNNLLLREGKGGLVQEREREREKGTSTNFGWQASVSIGAKLSEIDVTPNLAEGVVLFQIWFFFFAFRRLRLGIRSSGGVCHKLVHLLASKYCTHHSRLCSKDGDNGRTSRGHGVGYCPASTAWGY